MLSALVNFLAQPGKVHCTAFSAVWIFECLDAWPEVVKVFSHPWLSRYLHGYRLPVLSADAPPLPDPELVVSSSSYGVERLSPKLSGPLTPDMGSPEVI